MNKLYEPFPNYERYGYYANAWGYRNGSNVAKLIDHIRDEYRAKYGMDYRLIRLGKNRYRAIPGNDATYTSKSARQRAQICPNGYARFCGSYGISYAKQCGPMFGITIV